MKLQKFDDLLLKLIFVFEARDTVSAGKGCKAAGYPRKAQENKRSHTDNILPSPSAERAMHEYKLCFNSLACFAHYTYT